MGMSTHLDNLRLGILPPLATRLSLSRITIPSSVRVNDAPRARDVVTAEAREVVMVGSTEQKCPVISVV